MNRTYLIFNVSEINLIDFSQVLETSADTLRRSLDGQKTFVKWDGESPSFIDSLTTKEGTYSNSEILDILSGSEWTSNDII